MDVCVLSLMVLYSAARKKKWYPRKASPSRVDNQKAFLFSTQGAESIFLYIFQEALVRLMGRENFEQYGGHIWQLKFCDCFKRS